MSVVSFLEFRSSGSGTACLRPRLSSSLPFSSTATAFDRSGVIGVMEPTNVHAARSKSSVLCYTHPAVIKQYFQLMFVQKTSHPTFTLLIRLASSILGLMVLLHRSSHKTLLLYSYPLLSNPVCTIVPYYYMQPL